MFKRKYIFNPGPFSIAMLVYQIVARFFLGFFVGEFSYSHPRISLEKKTRGILASEKINETIFKVQLVGGWTNPFEKY